MDKTLDISLLKNIIIGKIEPHIYAFSTNTIPNYLKVGDTFRAVNIRIDEWKKHYPNLVKKLESSSMLEDGSKYFRDFSVHQFLENEKKYKRLKEYELGEGIYYSKEFFKDASVDDINEAINDIKDSYNKKMKKYQFYNSDSKLQETYQYVRDQNFKPRPNQQKTIDKFKSAVSKGRTNLLMYAVMRFGKSFTSMCCANEINAKLVVIVSAKADVKEEWKKTIESHVYFKEYQFLSSAELIQDDNIVSNILNSRINEKTKIAVFLTLQDLQGKGVKERHKEIFKNKIDLLIIDETHFGARAEKYGKVLKDEEELLKESKKAKDDDSVLIEEAEEQIKILKAKIKLHLSGTPYRILMGSEFKAEDIIAFYQFTDIADEQQKWIEENNEKPEEEQKEDWENPYYGFPQMIRFAFNPNKSSREKLKELKEKGVTYALSTLLKPQSIVKTSDGKHKKFIYEKEVEELLEVIDGKKDDDELFGFLNYDKIKDGKMCRHLVMVLPYRASCDAMEELIKNTNLPRLGKYEIINISGVDNPKLYKTTSAIKNKIKELEKQNKKTITLTVNRMLTGSTVPEWDTMLYFKDTSSPQEYDQAIFRLQNQYIKTYKTDDGKKEIKINMKPQTLLVDFLPLRTFQMQEKKAKIYNVNIDEGGNNKLKERITKELEISPIIAVNKNKIVQVESSDILEAISGYKMNKGIKDEAFDIPVDLKILDDITIKNVISKENELDSKSGLKIQAYIEDSNIDEELDITENESNKNDNIKNTNNLPNNQEDKESWEKKIQSYYAKILFFAFLTSDKVISLKDILDNLNKSDNKRIVCNLGLNSKVLKTIYDYYYKNDKFILSALDYKIQDLSNLSHKNLELEEKLNVAMSKFGKLGSSVVITPSNICDDMVNLLPKDAFKDDNNFLDIAGVYGEFAISIVKKYKEHNSTDYGFENLIYTIPKNSICYELTRKVYEMLDLNIDNIATFYSEDLLKVKNKKDIDYNKITKIICQNKPFNKIQIDDKIDEGADMCRFNSVLGNPPYNVDDGGAGASSAPIYQHFIRIGKQLSKSASSFIVPTRWYTGGKGLDDFREEMLIDKNIEYIHDFIHPEQVFPGTNNRGGVCFFGINKNYDNTLNKVRVINHGNNEIIEDVVRPFKITGFDIFIRYWKSVSILNKVYKPATNKYMSEFISSRQPFGIESNFSKSPNFLPNKNGLKNAIECLAKGQKIGYVNADIVKEGISLIKKWKVYTPRANNIGTELTDDNFNTIIGKPNSICTEAYIVIGKNLNLDREKCENICKYFKTQFARFLHSLAKASHDASSKTYAYIPLQDFSNSSDIDWSKSIDNIDNQLYKKYKLSQDEIIFIKKIIKPME